MKKMKKYICEMCKKEITGINYGDGVIDYPDLYDYRGFYAHEECYDKLVEWVDKEQRPNQLLKDKSKNNAEIRNDMEKGKITPRAMRSG